MPPREAATAPSRADVRRDHTFASTSLRLHVQRGALGFGSLLMAWFLWPRVGWPAFVPGALGVVALRGCPTCWTIGLVQTVARGRYRRVCEDGSCSLVPSSPAGRGSGPVP